MVVFERTPVGTLRYLHFKPTGKSSSLKNIDDFFLFSNNVVATLVSVD